MTVPQGRQCPFCSYVAHGPSEEDAHVCRAMVVAHQAGLGAFAEDSVRRDISPSKARQGLDRLLAEYPTAEAVRVVGGRQGARGPSTEVDLEVVRPLGNTRIMKFAIWDRTGNIYLCDQYGAADDEPFIEITPLGSTFGYGNPNA